MVLCQFSSTQEIARANQDMPEILLEGGVMERGGRRLSCSFSSSGRNGLRADSRDNKWSKKFLQRDIIPMKCVYFIRGVLSDIGQQHLPLHCRSGYYCSFKETKLVTRFNLPSRMTVDPITHITDITVYDNEFFTTFTSMLPVP